MAEEMRNLVRNRPSTEIAYAPWWVNPFWFCMIVVLGVYCLTAIYADEIIHASSRQKVNLLDSQGILLGLLAIASLCIGTLPVMFRKKSRRLQSPYSPAKLNIILFRYGFVMVLFKLMLVAPLIAHPVAIHSLMVGSDMDYVKNVRGNLGLLPGFTSFAHADVLFFSLYGYVVSVFPAYPKRKSIRFMFYALLFFDAALSVVAAQRTMLVKVIICYMIPIIIFRWKNRAIKFSAPMIGAVIMYAFFSFGEYFRSWRFFRFYGGSFLKFTLFRLLGYFATSLNNGAGFFAMHGPFYQPVGTISGIYGILHTFGYDDSAYADAFLEFQKQFGSTEFNSPCGLYVPFIDYGVFGGCMVLIVSGLFLSYLYKKMLSHSLSGILFFPITYYGLMIVFNLFAWGDTLYIRPLVAGLILIMYMKRCRIYAPQTNSDSSVDLPLPTQPHSSRRSF